MENDKSDALAALTRELRECKAENNRLARELRAALRRIDILRLNTDTQFDLTKSITGEKRQQELYFNLMLRLYPDIVFVFDDELKFTIGTQNITDIIDVEDVSLLRGHTLASIVDRYCPSIFTDEMLDAIERVKTGNEKGVENKIDISTEQGQFEVTILSFNMGKGSYSGILAIIHDITEVNLAKEQAEAGNRAKSEFLSRINHEIRTPIHTIMGMTGVAINSDDLEKKNACLDKINTASKHLLDLFDDIMDMSKVEKNKLDLTVNHFDFQEMIHHVVKTLRFKIEEKKLRFDIALDPDIPPALIGDDVKLAQIIVKLLSNAAKFTPAGGTVKLQVRRLQDTAGWVQLMIAVSDDGIGISSEQQTRLFDSFEQADGSNTRKFGGAGIGLALVWNIVTMMGGKIWVESEQGKGAKFIITLRLKKRVPDDMDEKEPVAKDYSGKTILIVDDMAVNQEIIASMLQDTHIRIYYASSGIEAINLFKNAPQLYDLILMDIQMPEMDGYAVTRAIRALPFAKAKEVPVLALTANAMYADERLSLDAGMNGHINKPVSKKEILLKIDSYLAPLLSI